MINEETLKTLKDNSLMSKEEKIAHWQTVDWIPEEDKQQIIDYIRSN